MAEKKQEFKQVEEDTWNLRDEFLELNIAGTVPVLLDPKESNGRDDFTVVGSATIVEYLDEMYKEPALVPGSIKMRIEVRRLQSWFDEKFAQEVSGRLVFEKMERRVLNLGAPDMSIVRSALEHIHYHMEFIGYLTEHRKWLAGDEISVADLAAAAHLSVLDYMGDVPWHKYDAAKEWYVRIKSRPSFRPLLTDRIMGMHPARHYDDLDF